MPAWKPGVQDLALDALRRAGLKGLVLDLGDARLLHVGLAGRSATVSRSALQHCQPRM